MDAIREGIAYARGSGIWAVIAFGEEVARFDHGAFYNIVDDAAVYYVDLLLDGNCDNVQSKQQVDACVLMATPSNGFAPGAELRLRAYIMHALQTAIKDKKPQTYVNSLNDMMQVVRDSAMALPSKKVTVALLQRLGLSG